MSNRDQTNEIMLEVSIEEQIAQDAPFVSFCCPSCNTDLVFIKRDISKVVMCTFNTCRKLIRLKGFEIPSIAEDEPQAA